MVEATLMAISLMWIPVGLLLLGYGEAKGTGALVIMVGTLVLVAAVLEAAIFKDPWLAALLFTYGLFYNIVGYALYAGLEDMRSVGNASLTLIPISIVYVILALIGTEKIAKSNFLALACGGYTVLYVMVWLNGYGKLSGKTLGVSLIVWTFIGLWVPAFWLLATGKLPF